MPWEVLLVVAAAQVPMVQDVELRLTAFTVLSTVRSSSFALAFRSKPWTLLVMLSIRDEKKPTSKFSLKAISWKAVKLLGASVAGGGALEICPSAITWIAESCASLGLGKPSSVGSLKARGSAGAAQAAPKIAAEAETICRNCILKDGFTFNKK